MKWVTKKDRRRIITKKLIASFVKTKSQGENICWKLQTQCWEVLLVVLSFLTSGRSQWVLKMFHILQGMPHISQDRVLKLHLM